MSPHISGLSAGRGDRMTPADWRRFEAKYAVEPNTGCWLWLANTKPDGYGLFHVGSRSNSRNEQSHRMSYEYHRERIPPGMVIDHLCRQRCCVNPDHLEVVTPAENTRRGDGGLANRMKTHCPSGHEYGAASTYTDHRGRRSCKTCWAARKKQPLRDDQRGGEISCVCGCGMMLRERSRWGLRQKYVNGHNRRSS